MKPALAQGIGEDVRVLVFGSRKLAGEAWRATIRRRLAALPPGSVVIHGAAPGADTMAGEEAQRLGLRVEPYPADWSRGPKAGPERNQRMLEKGRPDFALGFHEDPTLRRGSKDMKQRLEAARVPGRLVLKPDPR